MTKRTIVITTHSNINNFDVLGCHLELSDDINVMFHQQPKMQSDDYGQQFNFDIMISPFKFIGGYDYSELLPAHRFVNLPLLGKTEQAAKLRNYVAQFKNDNTFIPVHTWQIGMGDVNYPRAFGHVVIKPFSGARGVGQYTVDLSRISLQVVSKVLKGIVAPNNTKQDILAALKPFDGAVVPHWGKENHEGEGIDLLQSNGMMAQSIVEDVVSEYRVITNSYGEPEYWQKRTINNQQSNLPQASGGGSLINKDNIRAHVFVNETDAILFKNICKNVIGPMNSVDLFVTKEGWGIFEYSNQFGITGVPNTTARKLHVDFIRKLVNEYLETEELMTQGPTAAHMHISVPLTP